MTLTIPEIERLLANATPGPWEIDPHSDMPDCMNDVWFSDEIRICADAYTTDARLMAAAPDLARLAIDHSRELAAANARIAELEGASAMKMGMLENLSILAMSIKCAEAQDWEAMDVIKDTLNATLKEQPE